MTCAAVLTLVAPAAALADKPGSPPAQSHGGNPSHGAPTTTTTTTTATTTTTPAVGSAQSARGVVQTVSSVAVVVRQLDGSAVIVPIDRKTHVFVNNKLTQWDDVRPGFVLVASWKAGKPATTLRFLRPA